MSKKILVMALAALLSVPALAIQLKSLKVVTKKVQTDDSGCYAVLSVSYQSPAGKKFSPTRMQKTKNAVMIADAMHGASRKKYPASNIARHTSYYFSKKKLFVSALRRWATDGTVETKEQMAQLLKYIASPKFGKPAVLFSTQLLFMAIPGKGRRIIMEVYLFFAGKNVGYKYQFEKIPPSPGGPSGACGSCCPNGSRPDGGGQ